MIPIVTAVLTLAAAPVYAGNAKAHPAGEPETVEVHGTLPDSLHGTWLMIQSAEAKNKFVNFWSVYTITHKNSQWSMQQLTGQTPPALQQAINAANTAGQRLEPDTKLLATVNAATAKFKRPKVAERNKRYTFYTADNKPTDEAPELKDAILVLALATVAANSAVSGNRYFFREVTADKLSGRFTAGIVAITPYAPVVPIGLKGDVTMYRLK